MEPIERTTRIEDLVRGYPGAVSFMINRRLPCLVCGEPVWGTIEEVAREAGLSDAEIDRMLITMNATLTE